MGLMTKILKRFNNDFNSYNELLKLRFLVLFTVKLNNQKYFGFVNEYKPSKGLVSFILSPTTNDLLNQYNNNKIKVTEFF